ncbi:MAG: type II toxin-antitoxin system Phd/YefM family antitoxin [Patescibacteria group bacterium]
MNIPLLPQIPLIKSVTDLRYKAREIVALVVEDGKTVLVTRDSDPVAVLFPVALYESIREYIEDSKDIADLKKALAKNEPATDFETFDKTLRKRHGLAPYVSSHHSK